MKAGTSPETNKISEGVFAIALNLFRRINIFIGNPIDPIAENIINDFKDITANKNYKEIVNNIHENMEKNFWELQDEAEDILEKLQEAD